MNVTVGSDFLTTQLTCSVSVKPQRENALTTGDPLLTGKKGTTILLMMFFITATWADLWHGKAAWTELALLLHDFGNWATSLSPSKISTQFAWVCPESHSTQEGKDIHSTALTFHLRTAVVDLKTDLWSAWTKKADLAECSWCYSRQLTRWQPDQNKKAAAHCLLPNK